VTITRPPGRPWPLRLFAGRRPVQATNSVFPVVPGIAAEFVEHKFLGLARALVIALINHAKILPFRLASQRNPPQTTLELGYILDVSTAPPPVTF
jgi:hypothetical protein